MINLIDKDYFIGELAIPNVTDTDISGLLDKYIADCQEKILLDLLGSDLYLAFEAGLALAPGSQLQKWKDLRDGKTYTVDYNGSTFSVKYKGLFNTTTKKSILAYFVYFYFARDGYVQLIGNGASVSKYENSDGVTPNQKIIPMYNKGIEMYGNPARLKEWANDAIYIYGSDLPIFNNVPSDNLKANCYNFLLAMNEADSTTYPNWVFKKKNWLNTFGI